MELNVVKAPKFLFSSLNKKKKEIETNGKQIWMNLSEELRKCTEKELHRQE